MVKSEDGREIDWMVGLGVRIVGNGFSYKYITWLWENVQQRKFEKRYGDGRVSEERDERIIYSKDIAYILHTIDIVHVSGSEKSAIIRRIWEMHERQQYGKWQNIANWEGKGRQRGKNLARLVVFQVGEINMKWLWNPSITSLDLLQLEPKLWFSPLLQYLP